MECNTLYTHSRGTPTTNRWFKVGWFEDRFHMVAHLL